MAELAEQEIEGVKFTPKASLDMDKIYADGDKNSSSAGDGDGAGAGAGAGGGDGAGDAGAAAGAGDGAGDNGAAAGGGANTDKTKVVDNNDNDDVDLNDIMVTMGGQERPVSEIMKDYEEISKKNKEIESDEFLKNFIDHYLAGGDPSDYLKSKQDLTKVDDFSLVKNKFWEANADLDEDVREALFERELNEKYGITNLDGSFDDDDSKAAKIGKQLLKRDAEKVRSEKSESQKKFEVKRREVSTQEPAKVNPADQLKAISELPEVKDLLAKKSVALEDGVSLPVENPDEVIGMMADLNKFWAKFKDPKGNVNWNQVKRLMAFASNPAKYDSHLISVGGDRKLEGYLKEQKNIGGQEQKVIDKSLDTEGLNLNSEADREAFMKEMLKQKNKGSRR